MNVTYIDTTQSNPLENGGLSLQGADFLKYGLKCAWGLNVILGIVYLMLLNSLATQGFDLESIKADQLALQKTIEASDISLAIPSSMYALESNEIIQEMPLADYKSFFVVRDHEVAFLEKY